MDNQDIRKILRFHKSLYGLQQIMLIQNGKYVLIPVYVDDGNEIIKIKSELANEFDIADKAFSWYGSKS